MGTRSFRSRLTSVAAIAAALSFFAAAASAQTINAATINGSLAITTGGTFQSVLAAVVPPALRRSLTIQNNNASDTCWIEIGSTQSITEGNSIELLAGQAYTRFYPYVPSDAIWGTCASNGDTLYVDTQ